MTQQLANTEQLNQQANQFTLTDAIRSTRIVFFPQAPGPVRSDDPPAASQLNYQGPEGEFTFRGNEIDKQQTPLGLLITVTLQPDFDAGQLTLTLILPDVNLGNEHKQDFDTVAIKAKTLGFVVDRTGAQLAYFVLPLKGIAQSVILPL